MFREMWVTSFACSDAKRPEPLERSSGRTATKLEASSRMLSVVWAFLSGSAKPATYKAAESSRF